MHMPHVMVGDPVGKTLVITVQADTSISISLHQIVSIVHGLIFGSPKKVLMKVCLSKVDEKKSLTVFVSAA